MTIRFYGFSEISRKRLIGGRCAIYPSLFKPATAFMVFERAGQKMLIPFFRCEKNGLKR